MLRVVVAVARVGLAAVRSVADLAGVVTLVDLVAVVEGMGDKLQGTRMDGW